MRGLRLCHYGLVHYMKVVRILLQAAIIILVFSFGLVVRAADYPAPKEGDWIARDFRFHIGEIIPMVSRSMDPVGSRHV
jgi:hypothetical protein